jgi:hypothetical protein
VSALRSILASFGVEFDGKQLEKGNSLIEGTIGTLGRLAPALAGAFGLHEIISFTTGLADQAVELKHHSEALGISAQSLQQWQFAANLSGVSSEELQIGLQKLQRSAVGAGGAGGELAATFTKLHVSVKNANGTYKNADELLTDVAGAIGDMTDPTLQTATAMEIFGRGGARLLPFLKQGRAGVAGLKGEMDDLGGGFTDDFIAKSEDMVKGSKELSFALKSLGIKAVESLIPDLTGLEKGATKVIRVFGDWVKNSNATKTALIALGIGGTLALAPLLLSIAPLVAGFLLLEDALTFFTGGKSLTGDLLDKIFGPGAAAKVKAFADALTNDVGPVAKQVLAIFTDGQPLEVRFQELYDYIANVLKPKFKADFGEMGDSITTLVESAAILAKSLADIVEAMKWVATHTINAIGGAMFSSEDAEANKRAREEAGGSGNSGPKRVATAADIQAHFDSLPWYERAFGHALGFNAAQAAPVDMGQIHQAIAAVGTNASAPAVASAPFVGPPPPPDVKQTYNTTINQNITGSADDVKKGAADGAKSGITDAGAKLLAAQAAIKKTTG